MAISEYPGLKIPILQNLVEWGRGVANVVNGIMLGKTNNTGELTLTANVGSTTITVASGKVSLGTKVFLSPTTANAATEYGAGTWRYSVDPDNNQFTITHVNNAQTDRTFGYILVG